MTFKSGFKSDVSSGFEILSSFFGKIHFYNYEIIIESGNTNFSKGNAFQGTRRIQGNFAIVESTERRLFIPRTWFHTSVFISPQRRRVRVKIRIECIVCSSTRALRDRRLNSLYRRIIANENIGCAGITNGRGADEMHDPATSRPISSAKKCSLDGFFYRMLLPTMQTISNLFAYYCPLSFVCRKKYYFCKSTNRNVRFKRASKSGFH